MSTEQNKALVRRFYEEVFNQGKYPVIDEIFSSNYVSHSPNQTPGIPENRDGVHQGVKLYRDAMPDIHLKIEDLVAEGDRVICRWTATGTHTGDLMGIAPTGKKGTVTGMDIERIENGKLAEGWTVFDQLGMLQQLGVIPAPGARPGVSSDASPRGEKRPPEPGVGRPTA